MITVKWTSKERDDFAENWPCCDIPSSGWATFDDSGDLIDLSTNSTRCEFGGGLVSFLEDLRDKEISGPASGGEKIPAPDFDDAQKERAAHPDTFAVPNKEALDSLQVGDFVKLVTNGERFWVMVTKAEHDLGLFEGVVDNNLLLIDAFGYGDQVRFELRHIYAMIPTGTTTKRRAK